MFLVEAGRLITARWNVTGNVRMFNRVAELGGVDLLTTFGSGVMLFFFQTGVGAGVAKLFAGFVFGRRGGCRSAVNIRAG